jgi:hypothetical protein
MPTVSEAAGEALSLRNRPFNNLSALRAQIWTEPNLNEYVNYTRYLTATNGGGVCGEIVNTGATEIGDNEQFYLVMTGERDFDGRASFNLLTSNDKYIEVAPIRHPSLIGTAFSINPDASGANEQFTLCVLSNDNVAIRTTNGHYVSVSENVSGACLFSLTDSYGKQNCNFVFESDVAFANPAGDGHNLLSLNADAQYTVTKSERIAIQYIGGSGRRIYISANPDANIFGADVEKDLDNYFHFTDTIEDLGQFELLSQGRDSYKIKTKRGDFLTVSDSATENSGATERFSLFADKTAISDSEIFDVLHLANGKVALRTSDFKFLSVVDTEYLGQSVKTDAARAVNLGVVQQAATLMFERIQRKNSYSYDEISTDCPSKNHGINYQIFRLTHSVYGSTYPRLIGVQFDNSGQIIVNVGFFYTSAIRADLNLGWRYSKRPWNKMVAGHPIRKAQFFFDRIALVGIIFDGHDRFGRTDTTLRVETFTVPTSDFVIVGFDSDVGDGGYFGNIYPIYHRVRKNVLLITQNDDFVSYNINNHTAFKVCAYSLISIKIKLDCNNRPVSLCGSLTGTEGGMELVPHAKLTAKNRNGINSVNVAGSDVLFNYEHPDLGEYAFSIEAQSNATFCFELQQVYDLTNATKAERDEFSIRNGAGEAEVPYPMVGRPKLKLFTQYFLASQDEKVGNLAPTSPRKQGITRNLKSFFCCFSWIAAFGIPSGLIALVVVAIVAVVAVTVGVVVYLTTKSDGSGDGSANPPKTVFEKLKENANYRIYNIHYKSIMPAWYENDAVRGIMSDALSAESGGHTDTNDDRTIKAIASKDDLKDVLSEEERRNTDMLSEFHATFWAGRNAPENLRVVGISHSTRCLNIGYEAYPQILTPMSENMVFDNALKFMETERFQSEFCHAHGLTRKNLALLLDPAAFASLGANRIIYDALVISPYDMGEPVHYRPSKDAGEKDYVAGQPGEWTLEDQYHWHPHPCHREFFETIDIVADSNTYPGLRQIWAEYKHAGAPLLYFKCQFIARRDVFMKYIQFVRQVMARFHNVYFNDVKTKIYNNIDGYKSNNNEKFMRMYAYMGERLCSIFSYYLANACRFSEAYNLFGRILRVKELPCSCYKVRMGTDKKMEIAKYQATLTQKYRDRQNSPLNPTKTYAFDINLGDGYGERKSNGELENIELLQSESISAALRTAGSVVFVKSFEDVMVTKNLPYYDNFYSKAQISDSQFYFRSTVKKSKHHLLSPFCEGITTDDKLIYFSVVKNRNGVHKFITHELDGDANNYSIFGYPSEIMLYCEIKGECALRKVQINPINGKFIVTTKGTTSIILLSLSSLKILNWDGLLVPIRIGYLSGGLGRG